MNNIKISVVLLCSMVAQLCVTELHCAARPLSGPQGKQSAAFYEEQRKKRIEAARRLLEDGKAKEGAADKGAAARYEVPMLKLDERIGFAASHRVQLFEHPAPKVESSRRHVERRPEKK